MPRTSFEQFLNVLRNGEARRYSGLRLTDAEAAGVASDPEAARALYESWVGAPRPQPLPLPGWYSAPHAGNEMRYWDGAKWLEISPPAPETAAARSAGSSTRALLEEHPALVVSCIAAALSFFAVFPWGYEYYIFLRWTLSITAVFLGIHAVRSSQQIWLLAAIPILVLWAPGALIPLERVVWGTLNVVAAGVLVAAGWYITRPATRREDGKPRWEWWKIAALTFGIALVFALIAQPGNRAVDCDVRYERSGTFCD
ncbi:MAG: DUF6804 family protein [Microbacteriaceae bacterium]|jgi:hypothetical protein|nr:DUF2510 domain-containing protein [Microbacteriaceae bacterium]HPZ34716.1 DUF2510 domain-containing protein [Microbacteriaceae bacterium]HQC93173.1 DUF2510 domain-containing protein [Microbacteriaceae bacterium]